MAFKSARQRKAVMAKLRNANKGLFFSSVTSKDWKESWDNKDLQRGVRLAQKKKGKVIIIQGDKIGTDFDTMVVTRGIPQRKAIQLFNDYGPAIDQVGSLKATNIKELEAKAKTIYKKIFEDE